MDRVILPDEVKQSVADVRWNCVNWVHYLELSHLPLLVTRRQNENCRRQNIFLTYFVNTGDKFDAVADRVEINCLTCRRPPVYKYSMLFISFFYLLDIIALRKTTNSLFFFLSFLLFVPSSFNPQLFNNALSAIDKSRHHVKYS